MGERIHLAVCAAPAVLCMAAFAVHAAHVYTLLVLGGEWSHADGTATRLGDGRSSDAAGMLVPATGVSNRSFSAARRPARDSPACLDVHRMYRARRQIEALRGAASGQAQHAVPAMLLREWDVNAGANILFRTIAVLVMECTGNTGSAERHAAGRHVAAERGGCRSPYHGTSKITTCNTLRLLEGRSAGAEWRPSGAQTKAPEFRRRRAGGRIRGGRCWP